MNISQQINNVRAWYKPVGVLTECVKKTKNEMLGINVYSIMFEDSIHYCRRQRFFDRVVVPPFSNSDSAITLPANFNRYLLAL